VNISVSSISLKYIFLLELLTLEGAVNIMKYETNRKWLLVIGAIMIGYFLVKIPLDGQIPFLKMKIQDKEKLAIALFLLIFYFFVYTIYTWFRLKKENRSKFDLITCIVVGLVAMVPAVLQIFDFVGVTWKSISLTFGLLFAGAIFGFTFNFVVTIAFSLRSNHEMEKLGLGRVPSAAKAFLRALGFFFFPVDILLIVGIVSLHPEFPKPLDTYWWVFVLCAFFCLNIDTLLNLMLCLGPSPVRGKACKRLRWFRGPMDIHEMQYQLIGLEPKMKYEEPVICKLAMAGRTDLLSIYLSNGQDPNKRTGRGWTPLMLASAEGHLSTADILLRNGADPNAENYLGRTALMYASRYGYVGIVRNLIEHGADVNPVRKLREHPALLAAAQYGHNEVVSFLIEKGADVFYKNSDGKNALDLAMEAGHGDVAKILRVSMNQSPHEDNVDQRSRSFRWIEKELESQIIEPKPDGDKSRS
jgi:drug/metabolite transporter (DMT)-like permease